MRISVYHILLLLIFLIYLNQNLFAQLVVDPTAMPEEMVENIVDESINYFNIYYIGDDNASGIFSIIDTTDLGMNDGIILTSGDASLSIGPNNTTAAGIANGQPGHPLLNQLFGFYSADASILEFEFLSTFDLINCKIIFGSEEYPEWVQNPVGNESFGLFISGSNPLGGLYVDTNFAIIPDTNLSISVNNINNIIPSYSELYIDNTNGIYIQYDGFTTVIDLFFYVIPDSIYITKIIIGDYGDPIYDSGVFIEKDSFKSVSSTELLSFNFQALINPGLSEDYTGTINNDSIFISLPYSTNLTSLVASFTTYPYISVYIDAILQISDITTNDFSEPIIYTLISPVGNNKDWTIIVDYLPNTENEIWAYAFLTENNPNLLVNIIGEIIGQQIKIEAPIGTDLSNLVATFLLSDNATAFVDGIVQQSGVTPNNFNDTLIYAVEAENGDICYYFTTTTLVTRIHNSMESQLSIYPNPAKDFIYIDHAMNSYLKMYDYAGKLLVELPIKSQNKKVSVGHLPAGVYFIRIDHFERPFLKKIIIN